MESRSGRVCERAKRGCKSGGNGRSVDHGGKTEDRRTKRK